MLTKMRFERLRISMKGYEMAKHITLSPTMVSSIERRRMTATKEWQERIAQTLNLPVCELFEDNGLAAVVEED